jgi:hypothetical protein
MKGGHAGNPAKSLEEKPYEPLRNGPVSMDQIEFSFLGNPESARELGEEEKRRLHERQGTFFHVFQDACAVTQSLKLWRIEIRKARDPDSAPEFMPLAAMIMGGDNLEFDSELLQFFAEAENKDPGGISRKSRKRGCEDQNSQGLPTECEGYLRSLLYSMSNHMPKKRLCSPLTRVKTRAMALIRGMAP